MNDDLDRLLMAARERGPLTKAELAEQRLSFVMAEAGFGSDSDEAAYAAALAGGDENALRRLDQEADARVASAERAFDRSI